MARETPAASNRHEELLVISARAVAQAFQQSLATRRLPIAQQTVLRLLETALDHYEREGLYLD